MPAVLQAVVVCYCGAHDQVIKPVSIHISDDEVKGKGVAARRTYVKHVMKC